MIEHRGGAAGSGMDGVGGRAPAGAGTGAGLPAEAVEWGFRLLAGREPVTAAEFAAFRALPDLDAMRRAFTNIPEFHGFFDAVLTGVPAWTMPLFLLRPSAVPGLAWRFEPPTLGAAASQLCTAAQFAEPIFAEILAAMGFPAAAAAGLAAGRSRAAWEQAWAVAVLARQGLIAPGRRGLAIEAGRERVAALLASRGVEMLATARGVATDEDARARRTHLFHPEILDLDEFERMVGMAGLDPREVARLGDDHDFCVSFGLPGALGSVASALEAIAASLAPLRPGGLALHAFAFNLTSDEVTWELPGLVVLRRRDIEALGARLLAEGHTLLDPSTHPGLDPEDERVKLDPSGPPGLRQRHGVVVATSFGLAIRKAG